MRVACCALVVLALSVRPAGAQPLTLLDVPFISQSEALCGGAAAAMVMRYWGAQGVTADTFAPLVDRSAAGIRTDVLVRALAERGYAATGIAGTEAQIAGEIARGRPVITLIEDRPGTFHYVVVVGWHPRGVVFHDPARAAFQVMTPADFAERWRQAQRWMLVLLPPVPAAPAATNTPVNPPRPTASSSCEQRIQEGIAAAGANRLEAAEQFLTTAISCPGGAAFRELAGIRLLQRRWPEVRSLAAAALREDPNDVQAWKLLGAARFVEDDTAGALEAWNHVQEPKLDLIQIDGLRRTRQRVVETLVDVSLGDVLTAGDLRRARRSLSDLPSALASSVSYVPTGSGQAQLQVSLVERPLLPGGLVPLTVLAVRAAANREIEAGLSSLSGGGERLTAGWRFWPHRPRYELALSAPAAWGGVLEIRGVQERQPFTRTLPPSRYASADVRLARWTGAAVRWSAGGGLARWHDRGVFAAFGGVARIVSPEDRVDVTAEVEAWVGGDSAFSRGQLAVTARSSGQRAGSVFVGRGALTGLSGGAPAELWASGDTGHARPVLLRAHPLVTDGRLRTERLGRTLVAASMEAQHWIRTGPLSMAPAAFLDLARTSRRLEEGPVVDADVGVGVRLAAPGTRGMLRFDLAQGLRDGATTLSLVYER